jgi:putative hydrolase
MPQNPGADEPNEEPEEGRGDPGNPFTGTPFEAVFQMLGGQGGQLPDLSALMGGQGAGGPGGFDLSALMGQFQAMMQPHDGTVNWNLARDTARRVTAASADPSVTSAQDGRIGDALRLADHWLDGVTELPSGIATTVGWSRAEWVEQTLPVWQQLVEPVAQHVVKAMTEALPAETRAMAGPLMGMLGQAGGAIFGAQIGHAIGTLATEVLGATDIGLPLAPVGRAALVAANVEAFADGLDVPAEDVRLYLALREAAHQRLFAHVPWLRGHLIGAVEDYGRGMSIDLGKIEEQLGGVDPTNPAALQEAMAGGMFEPQKTPSQQAALVRLETLLALVEGWVDDVVNQACADRMPSAGRLQEVIRRRRAAGGPAEDTFAALVGLELRPRRLRDAAALWGNLRVRKGVEARDSVWSHPDHLPTAADLDDPLGFAEGTTPAEIEDQAEAMLGDDFDAALQELLAREDGSGPAGPADEPGDDPTR